MRSNNIARLFPASLSAIVLANVFFLFSFCRQQSDDSALSATLDKEISNRISILTGLSKYDDSLSHHVNYIHTESQKLILLSKDFENLQASTIKSNLFFSSMALKHEVNPSQYVKLNNGMDPSQIALSIKENELALFNQLIFKNSGADIQLFSAGENEEE